MEITINSHDLAQLISDNRERIGSTDWDIYVNDDGDIDCRHNTYINEDWYEIVDLYSFWDDDETVNCPIDELSDWYELEAIILSDIEDKINYTRDNDDKVSLKWEK